MNEQEMRRVMMLACLTFTVLAGLAAVGVLILASQDFNWGLILIALLLTGGTVTSAWAASYYGQKVSGPIVFTNAAEREVLTTKQRRELKRKRGEVVMEKALIEVEHERDNIVHRQIEESNDPTKPPYITQWSKELPMPPVREKRRREYEDDR